MNNTTKNRQAAIALTRCNLKPIGPKASNLSEHQLEGFRLYLKYDPLTGLFTWQNHDGFKGKNGEVAGTFNKDGYLLLSVRGTRQYGHRIAWYLTYGGFPPAGYVVDHKDRNPGNNKLENLREVLQGKNVLNTNTPRAHGKRGILGVSQARGTDRFFSRITLEGVTTHLGSFDTAELASAAYQKAKLEQHQV